MQHADLDGVLLRDGRGAEDQRPGGGAKESSEKLRHGFEVSLRLRRLSGTGAPLDRGRDPP